MSNPKRITNGHAARKQLVEGANMLRAAVEVTLGPRGRNVMIDRGYDLVVSTKDGVTVAREVEVSNSIQNIGVAMIKIAAEKTSDDAGDGTTTSTVLATNMVAEAHRLVVAGMAPVDLQRGMQYACRRIVANVVACAEPVTSTEDIRRIGFISSNGDDSIGNTIAEMMDAVGKDGVIQVEESNSVEDQSELMDGTQIDRGWINPGFLGDGDSVITLHNPLILLSAEVFDSAAPLQDLLTEAMHEERCMLIVSKDVSGSALQTMLVNNRKGIFESCAIKAPLFGDKSRAMLEDMAVMFGGQIVCHEKGKTFQNLEMADLGTCEKVTVNKSSTIFIGGGGNVEDIQSRIVSLRAQRSQTWSTHDTDWIQKRISMLSGGVGIIKVGGKTEPELRERKDRYEDALCATRAAVDEGVVAGGGLALFRAAEKFAEDERDFGPHNDYNRDFAAGCALMVKAAQTPVRRIAYNAGAHPEVVVATLREVDPNVGYDARNDHFVDMVEAGIIDPARVVRCALENATSIASTMIMVETVVDSIENVRDQDLSGGLHL